MWAECSRDLRPKLGVRTLPWKGLEASGSRLLPFGGLLFWGVLMPVAWAQHLAHFCTTVVTEELVLVRIVHVHVVGSHRQQHKVHELLVTSIARLALLMCADIEVLA